MAAFATLHGLHDSLLRSQFLGQDHHFPLKQPSTLVHQRKPTCELQPRAKFNIVEIMGGRGICKGEMGLEQELKRQVDEQPQQVVVTAEHGKEHENSGGGDGGINSVAVPEDAFEKEMMGLTGGFPGGEKGLIKFIEENPPPKPGTVLSSDPLILKESQKPL
ncbi:NAD(P)H-quinone oxidoreductase subunit S, chloroplastic-like [Gastrolobium bilobum]|uniref:NAD(P)H-quinone oxidoreductase subunit S, chloroplastic-like n=1 Tax=Gastrolobium bilobum TaxID=150636 RepID=UPI002AB1D12B|nr:NAD(P)H-quinone oxidoreductase subunit S, chloroplastic-like [Gastrolobium bilobum]